MDAPADPGAAWQRHSRRIAAKNTADKAKPAPAANGSPGWFDSSETSSHETTEPSGWFD